MRFEAARKFDEFTVMERIATATEIQQLISEHTDRSYLLFPEDRKRRYEWRNLSPCIRVQRGPTGRFEGLAAPGEFYTFQVGVFAVKQEIEDLEIIFEDLIPVDSEE